MKLKNKHKPDLDPVSFTQYEITSEPIEEPNYRRLPKAVKERFEGLFYEVQRNPQQAIPKLLELKKSYSQVPQIYNYLAIAYSRVGDNEKAEAITEECIRRNPKYLFARVNYAEICIVKGEYEKVPEIFEHKYDLKMLYPKRKQFHITEFANFMGIMGLYFAVTEQREMAEKYHEILQDVAPEFEAAKRLKQKLHPGIFLQIMRRLLDGPSK